MTLRLKGSNSGDVSLKAPATAGNNTITLPTSNGSAEQFLKNSGTAGELEFSNMVETSDGDIGIGTTSPTRDLEVSRAGTAYIRAVNSSDSVNIDILAASSAAFVGPQSNHPLAFQTNNTERAQIDTSGRLFVGTTSELLSGDEKKLQILHADAGAEIVLGRNDSSVASGNSLGAIKYVGNDGGTYHQCAQIEAIADGSHSGSAKPTRLQFNVTSGSATTPSERLRIESEGRAMFFAETATTYMASAAGAGTSHALITGVHSNSTVSLRVWTNGNIQNTNDSYTGLSDIKLKENIVDAGSQWDDFKAIRFRKYNFKEETGHETHTQLGVIAQELETVCPGLVFETPDRDAEGNDLGTTTKGVKSSILTKKGLVALQEAMTRIETLETQNTAQQAQIDDLLARVTALEAA